MATLRLTPRFVAAVTTQQVQEEYWDDVVPGLALRVGRGGSKVFVTRYRANGKHRRLTIGRHPHLTLADAREKARKVIADAQGGADPAQEREQQRSADSSFHALYSEVMDAKQAKRRPATIRHCQQIMEADVLPAWGKRPAASITRRDVTLLLDRITKRGAPVQANRALAYIRSTFNEGLRRGFPGLESNPAHMLLPVADETPRDRYLTVAELVKVWIAAEWEAPVQRAIVRLSILTAQRSANILALRWDQIDASDVWTIPGAQFKGKRVHKVPLSTEALAVLAPLRELTGGGEYAFPGRGDGKAPHVNSTTKLMERLRKRADLAEPWTLHDLRTTFRTHCTRAQTPAHKNDPAGLGIDSRVCDAVLGHKDLSLGATTYTGDLPQYMLAEKREALEKWGGFVLRAVA